MRLAGFLLALLAPLSLSAESIGGTRVVVLPPVDLSASPEARAALVPLVVSSLEAKGYTIVPAGDVEDVVVKERVRYVDSLPAPALERLLDALSATAAVFTTLDTYRERPSPIVALSIRVVGRDQSTLYSAVQGLTPDDTEGLFGFGRHETLSSLSAETVARLLQGLPAPGSSVRAEARGKPLWLSAPSMGFANGAPDALRKPVGLAVLPFENFTLAQEAPRVVSEILAYHLRAAGYAVVEAGDLRQAAIAEGVRGFVGLDPEKLRAVSSRLSNGGPPPFFVRGAIHTYAEAGAGGGETPPKLQLHLEVIDAQNGRVVASGENQRAGDDYRGFLQLGAASNIVTLVDRAVGEAVAALAKKAEFERKSR